jgi:hypothetical protein
VTRHECPEDPDEFFHQLFLVMTYRPDVPDGFKECRICGGLYKVATPALGAGREGE